MKNSVKSVVSSATASTILFLSNISVFAADASVTGSKAYAAAIAIGLAAVAGAIAMGMAISKAADGISRQPEATSKIQTVLMLGLVFIETAIIYALIVAILIIFVL
ncbi:ATP synthase F0 subunit C [Floccifex sp.]|uniref:ATP synthase F0 subunit C n=1 Tax=Floccifex sp. TaxID=2815810 RepID=UPI003F0F7937